MVGSTGIGETVLVVRLQTNIFADMRTTSSFEIFPTKDSDRELARARWLRSEDRLPEAEDAYRRVMLQQPGIRNSWTECFDLLRQSGQTDEALALADAAERVFSTEAFPIALRGAALIEQERFPEALQALEIAVSRDPHLALTWHELGYAAYRLGNGSRALLALDRAFALEPHTETLTLRGRILREAGEFYAATVAFEAAMHSATHDGQHAEIEREVDVTQRLGDFAPRCPRELTDAERWFAKSGTVVLACAQSTTPPSTQDLAKAFANLASDRDWSFGQIIAAEGCEAGHSVADQFAMPCMALADIDVNLTPLMVAERLPNSSGDWTTALEHMRAAGSGMAFVAWHPIEAPSGADVIGALEREGRPLQLGIDSADAVVMAQHPKARVAGRNVTSSIHE